ncbi:hypothetical protein [Paenibacillus silvisoli]|uniref:hypothetical protein n=1 Tax=Paenibacillus silvisoli TaxID=3110539 RepID=UPI0028065A4F|nr:hypothetical protein [Paenibacillus silvisoli]
MEKTNDFLAFQVKKGRRILQLLMLINVSFTIVLEILGIIAGVFSFSSFVSAIAMIFTCLFLYGGSKAAKWIYIVLSGLGLLRFISIIISMIDGNIIIQDSFGAWILAVIPFLIYIVTSLVLIFSESVNEFIYKQAN